MPLLGALLAACAVLVPQLVFWKRNTGDWIYRSYGGEGFFFSRRGERNTAPNNDRPVTVQ